MISTRVAGAVRLRSMAYAFAPMILTKIELCFSFGIECVSRYALSLFK